MKSKIISTLVFILSIGVGLANEGLGQGQDSTKTNREGMDHQQMSADTVSQPVVMPHDESKLTADLSDFPTLHPLIVHFAIVLILVAAGLQLLNFYLMKKEISWIVAGILLGGVLAAWLAANNFHPHTTGLSEHVKQVLAQHDKWADWTINAGIVAVILQIINLFVFKGKRWAAGVIAVVLIVSAYSVSRAGHYGSQLVHIEGIGPQGKFLEMEHDTH